MDRTFTRGDSAEALRHAYPGAFSATDLQAVVRLPNGRSQTLGHLAAVSISTHRDKFPVTAFSFVAARGVTQGHRTVAGTLIFHTLDRGAWEWDLWGDARGYQPALFDELPPFDLLLSYANEYGDLSYEGLRGVTLLDGGRTVSLENLHPMESYSYLALDYLPLRPVRAAEDGRFLLQRSRNDNQRQLRIMGEERLLNEEPFLNAGVR